MGGRWTYVYTYAQVCIYIYTHICIYTYTYTYTDLYIHRYTCLKRAKVSRCIYEYGCICRHRYADWGKRRRQIQELHGICLRAPPMLFLWGSIYHQDPPFSLWLQVYKEYLFWALKYINRTYFGLFGALACRFYESSRSSCSGSINHQDPYKKTISNTKRD